MNEYVGENEVKFEVVDNGYDEITGEERDVFNTADNQKNRSVQKSYIEIEEDNNVPVIFIVLIAVVCFFFCRKNYTKK